MGLEPQVYSVYKVYTNKIIDSPIYNLLLIGNGRWSYSFSMQENQDCRCYCGDKEEPTKNEENNDWTSQIGE